MGSVVRTTLGQAYNAKLWGFLALVRQNSSPPTKKMGFGGSGGVGGALFGRFFAHFCRHFLTVGLTKKFIKQKMSRRVILVYLGRRVLTSNFNSSRQSPKTGTPFFEQTRKKIRKIKNVGKGHNSIPRTKGFDVTF